MKVSSLLSIVLFVFAIANLHLVHAQLLNFSPSNSPRLAGDWTPLPIAQTSYTATGTNLDGFLKPGLLQSVELVNNPATLAIDVASQTYFFNVTNSWYYANSEFACFGAPGYPVNTVFLVNSTTRFTSLDQIAGFTTVAQTGKTFGPDLGYTTITIKEMAIPTVGSTVTLVILPFLLYEPGQFVIVVPNGNVENFYQGKVISYIGDTLTLSVTFAVGSGTYTIWDVYVSGDLLYTGMAFDLTSCQLPVATNIIMDNKGFIKSWQTWESINVLQLNYQAYGYAAVDMSVSATNFDTITLGTPAASLLAPPPGCGPNGANYCTAYNMQPPYPAYIPFPNPTYYYQTFGSSN